MQIQKPRFVVRKPEDTQLVLQLEDFLERKQ